MRLFTYWCLRPEGVLAEQQPFGEDPLTLRYQHLSEPLQGGSLSKVTQPHVHPAPPPYAGVALPSCSEEEPVYKLSHEEEASSSSRNSL